MDSDGAGGLVPKFPLYLLPSFNIPFRRRRQSSTSTANHASPPNEKFFPALSSSPTDSILASPNQSPPTPSYFPSRFSFSKGSRRASVEPQDASKLSRIHPDTIKCSTCSTDLAFTAQIVSKGFTGRYGRAYLVSAPDHRTRGTNTGDLMNIKVGKPETRLLVTGSHTVADITCAICHAKVGWKYVDAKEESQKYKIGKFILETQRVTDDKHWEDVPVSELPELEMGSQQTTSKEDGEPIVFDSEDEDECEDIFSGTWDRDLVAKRRRGRVVNRL